MWPLLFIATQFGDPDSVPPTPPTEGVQLDEPVDYDVATTGTTSINHSWVSVPNASGYELQLLSGSWTTIASPTGFSYDHTSLAQNTMYRYRFRAKGDGVNFLDSDWVYRNTDTLPVTPPIVQMGNYMSTFNGATSAEITDVTNFLQALYNGGVDNYLQALYIPCVGDTLAHKLYNYMYPFDRDDCFRAVATGNATSVTKGVKSLTANTASIDFKIYPDLLSNAPMLGYAVWTDVPVQQCLYNSDASFFPIFRANSDGKAYPNIGKSSPGTTFTGSNAAGWQFVQRTDFNTVKGYLNNTLVFTDNVTIDKIDSQETSGTYFPVNFPIKLQCTEANVTFSIIAFWNNPMPTAVRVAFFNAVVTFLTARGVI